MNQIVFAIGADGSVLGRRQFGKGTIAMMRLQFSSSEGIAFTISSQRVPQAIIYDPDTLQPNARWNVQDD